MHEATYPDGRVEREIIYGKTREELHQKLAKAHQISLAGGAVKIMQRKMSRNEPCPCKSGRKFKNCCLRRNRRH